ncbi:MAG TPA: PEP-CTERM sorting domain-containing protein [Armatimonadaceae bacterium]|nr:PEP-CTERM sorting domain-containing protein [Armatimonadaceae bacterium]
MRLFAPIAVAILAVGVTLAPAPSARAQVFFDSISNADAIGGSGNTPRFFMGDVVSLQTPGGGPVTINRVDLVLRSFAAVTYDSLSVRLQLWNDNTGSTTQLFTNPASGVFTFDLGSILGTTSLAASTNYTFSLLLPTEVTFTDPFQNGIAVNYQGSTAGSGLVNTNDLSSGIRIGANAPAVGFSSFPSPQGGFLRDTTDRRDFNFRPAGDSFVITNQQHAGLAMRLYYAPVVPEPSTIVLTGLGLLALGAGALKRRRGASGGKPG